MKAKRQFLLLIMSLFTFALLEAKEVEVFLKISQKQFSLEDQVQMEVVVKGSREAGSWPQLNGFDHFLVTEGGTSSNMTIINGNVSSERAFTYYLSPKKEGQFTVGPANISIDGKQYQSNTVTLIVAKGEDRTAPNNDEGFFIEAFLDKEEAYLNQQVIYTFRFYHQGNILGAKLDMPEFHSFWKESLGEEREYRKRVDGNEYRVTEVKLALFPNKVGEIVLPSTRLQLEVAAPQERRHRDPFFDNFFSSRRAVRKVIRSKEISLKVNPLPQSGQRVTSSSVGEFFINATVDKREVEQGDSISLTIKITGDGNIRDVSLGKFNWDAGKVYEDSPQLSFDREGERLIGHFTQKLAIVPKNTGEILIPSLEFTYFDIHSKEYRTLKTDPIPLRVKAHPGEKAQKNKPSLLPMPEEKKEEFREDLRPLMREKSFFHSGYKLYLILFSSFFSLLALGITGLTWMNQKKTGGQKKAVKAKKSFLKKLNRDTSEVGVLLDIFKEYLIEKYQLVEIKCFVSSDIERLFSSQLSSSLCSEVKDFVNQCELVEYGGGGYSIDELKKSAIQLVNKIEKDGGQ